MFIRPTTRRKHVPSELGDDTLPWELEELDALRRALLLSVSRVVIETYRLARGNRLAIGHDVIANHRLVIRGPGRVLVADRVNLYAFAGRTRLVARTPGSLIRIGENARLNGPLLQADTLIEIGPSCILGQCHILDTDMHSMALDRRTNPRAEVRTAPVGPQTFPGGRAASGRPTVSTSGFAAC